MGHITGLNYFYKNNFLNIILVSLQDSKIIYTTFTWEKKYFMSQWDIKGRVNLQVTQS